MRLRKDIPALVEFLERGLEGFRFSFFVISAAPAGGDPLGARRDRAPGPHLRHRARIRPASGEVRAVPRVPAGYGKVSVLEELEARLGTEPDRTIYVGDGSSDVHVMLHVNNRDGFTIAVSENKLLARIAKRTVLSDSAFSVVVPILEHIAAWRSAEIRALFESYGLSLKDWERARTDRVTIREASGPLDAIA